MDVTRYSTLPYLEALYRDRQVLVTAASLRHNADAQLIMSHLSTRRVNIHVCTYNCTGASAAGTCVSTHVHPDTGCVRDR